MQTVKIRPDGTQPNTFSVIRSSISTSGFRSLYTGLTASLFRQMTYSLVRLGSYESLKARLSEHGPPSTAKLLLAGAVVCPSLPGHSDRTHALIQTGGLGGIAGNPAGESPESPIGVCLI
jgi:dicarboxylate transporter 10